MLAPLAVLAILFLRRRPATSAAVVALVAGYFIFRTQPNARYLYACLPLVTVAFAAVVGWADRRWLFRALIAFVLAVIGVNGYFLPSASYYHKEFSLRKPFSRADHDRFIAQSVPVRAVIAYYNRAHPNSVVLLTGAPEVAGVNGVVFENSWHQARTLSAINKTRSVISMVRLMESWKVAYFISPNYEYINSVQLREMLERCAEVEFAAGDKTLAHLLPTCKETQELRLATPLSAGGYDDPDDRIEFIGPWYEDGQFAQPWGHTVTYCDQPGASARLTFNGTGIRYVYTAALNRGIAQVLIDGREAARMNMYSKEPGWQSVRRFGDLPAGVHTFEVRVTGEKDPLSSGTVVDLDAVVIE